VTADHGHRRGQFLDLDRNLAMPEHEIDLGICLVAPEADVMVQFTVRGVGG